jgi:hypothetical protein
MAVLSSQGQKAGPLNSVSGSFSKGSLIVLIEDGAQVMWLVFRPGAIDVGQFQFVS